MGLIISGIESSPFFGQLIHKFENYKIQKMKKMVFKETELQKNPEQTIFSKKKSPFAGGNITICGHFKQIKIN